MAKKKKRLEKYSKKIEEPQKRLISVSVEKYLVIPILSIAIIIVVFLIFSSVKSFLAENRVEDKIPVCGDGSFYDTCSIRRPYMCERGFLVERARYCGCPAGFSKNEDQCTSSLLSGGKVFTFPYLFNDLRRDISINLYGDLYHYVGNLSRSISYNGDEKPFRVDFKFKKINEENQKQALAPLIVAIQNIEKNKDNRARIAISLVQNIPFEPSNKKVNISENKTLPYSRYPYEVLYENAGICGEKSELLVFLLKELGFGTVLFYNAAENHESVGIACPVEESYWNSGYCFVETSGPSIISDEEITYSGNLKLTSKPEIMFISGGISLSEDLQEYKDAENLDKIRNRVESGKSLSSSERKKLDELNSRYGLVEIYNA
jgi:hypothetical protein